MIELLLIGLSIVWIVTVVYLILGQREILKLRKRCKEKEDTPVAPLENSQVMSAASETLSIHDRVIEMHEFGESIEMIAQRLNIPQSQVEMTLKFAKIKHDSL